MRIVFVFSLIFAVAVAQEGGEAVEKTALEIDTGVRAASTYQNCDCQCNSITTTDGYSLSGNCQR